MTPVMITCKRTLSRARRLVTTSLAMAIFLAASGVLFAFRLERAEGTHQLLSSVWAISIAPFLPALAAIFGMDVWSDERRTGRINLLLTVDVSEWDFVLGKFFGILILEAVSIGLSLIASLGLLSVLAPGTLLGARFVAFIPAVLALLLQSALWCAVAAMFSALCRQAFLSAALTAAFLVALPRGLWEGMLSWASVGRAAFGEMPFDAHVADIAAGVFPIGVIIAYLIFIVLALFVTVKLIALMRFQGRKSTGSRSSTFFTILMALSCAISFTVLACRLDFSLDLPVGHSSAMSQKLKTVISESSGHLTVTAFMSRKDDRFRPFAQYLRSLKRQADQLGGVEMTLRFVDPKWDIGPSERFVRQGASENSLIFEKGHRFVSIPLTDGSSDSVIASAIQRVALPPQRRDVYWTVGHGESPFNSYGARGMSDIARELSRNGYRNEVIDLSKDRIPTDCALLIVAGAKDAFSRGELDRIDVYLKSGGRLLVMLNAVDGSGITSILPTWGIRPIAQAIAGAHTISGSDVIVSDFADHPISDGLCGSRLIFERPLTFEPSAVTEGANGADRPDFVSVAKVAASTVVAAVERGSGAGSDLAIRPTRIVAIGDPTFVMNAQLSLRANANREFFMNVIAYLSGAESYGAGSLETEQLISGMDRSMRARFVLLLSAVIPSSLFVLMFLVLQWRRR